MTSRDSIAELEPDAARPGGLVGPLQPVRLLDFIGAIEKALGRNAVMSMLPMQPGDVESTYADIDAFGEAVGFRPCTPIDEGIARFIE